MIQKRIQIDYDEYYSLDELSPSDQALAKAAVEAQKGSYAPYSRFNVGAAVLLADGTVVTGANQENAASPSGLCAERTAMFAASANHPGTPMVEIAIAGGPDGTLCDYPATPCGSCRQVMVEYQMLGKRPMAVLMVGAKIIWKFHKIEDILPMVFDSLGK